MYNFEIWLVVALNFIAIEALACSGDYYSLPAGTQQEIDECGTCALVANGLPRAIFVPTKTSAEWLAFRTNINANTGGLVTLAACGSACTYPLDTIVAPAAAYSLRKIRSAYSGNVMRIRRSNDNAETDIGFMGTCGILDTGAISVFAGGNSAYVKTWYDQSGNARDATQTTNGSQPIIYNAGIIETKFSQPTIRFNGSTFIPGAALGLSATSSWSYSMVVGSSTIVNGGATDGAGTYYFDRTTASNNLTCFKAVGGKLCLQKRNDAGTGLGAVCTTTNISTAAIQAFYTQRSYNSAYSVYLNNTGETTTGETDGALTPPTPNIGRHVSTSITADYGIYEFIFWGSVLTSGDRTTVYHDQKTEFGF